MPAHRKPDDQRLRRNAPVVSAFLPANGYSGPIPEWPLSAPLPEELARWEWAWRTPMAAQWARMSIEPVIARYVRIAVQADEFGSKLSVAESNVKSEARQMEKELGLGPNAMRLMQWEIAEGDSDEQVEPTPIRRRLRAVDPAEGAS